MPETCGPDPGLWWKTQVLPLGSGQDVRLICKQPVVAKDKIRPVLEMFTRCTPGARPTRGGSTINFSRSY